MGTEVMALIGRLAEPTPEFKKDLANPFEDGSGYPYLLNENGEYIPTGDTEQWLDVYAQMDLRKIDYQGNLSLLIKEYQKKNKDNNHIYFFCPDGNTQFSTDAYGKKLVAIPLDEVVTAVEKDIQKDDYRRYKWFKALLEALCHDPEDLVCAFYGH